MFFILGRAIQLWNSIDLPEPVGKTLITSWPFRIDSRHFTWKDLKLGDGRIPLLGKNPTRRSTDKNSGLPAVFDVLFIVCDRMLIYYTHKFWVFGGHVTGWWQGHFPPHLQSQGKAPWGRGCALFKAKGKRRLLFPRRLQWIPSKIASWHITPKTVLNRTSRPLYWLYNGSHVYVPNQSSSYRTLSFVPINLHNWWLSFCRTTTCSTR